VERVNIGKVDEDERGTMNTSIETPGRHAMRGTTLRAVATLAGILTLLASFSPLAQAVDSPQGRLVAAAPATGTPHAGTAAGRTATTSTSVGRSVLFSVVVTAQ
jgi:hypothetical protein